jgi:GT2 family glycosyltransferase
VDSVTAPVSAAIPTTRSDSAQHRPATRASVTVVVLTYDGREDTLSCLDSLAESDWIPLSVVVVDNGSHDGTAAAVRAEHPSVTVLEQDDNLGFAEGNNVGMRHALASGADYVFVLNNDTILAPDTITRCVEATERHADAGAVCPMMYFFEPANLIWYAGAAFDPRRARSGGMLGYRELDRGQHSTAGETGRIAGAAVLFPREALERVGVFDGSLFLQFEDVEWSLRARQSGYRTYVAPEAKIWHKVSAGTGGENSPTLGYYGTRNHIIVCERYAPLSGLAALRRELAIVFFQLTGARKSKQKLAYTRAVMRGWLDGRHGNTGRRS